MIMRLSHLLVCFNLSANFIFYYLKGEKFRKAWIETYGNLFNLNRFVNSTLPQVSEFQLAESVNNHLVLGESRA